MYRLDLLLKGVILLNLCNYDTITLVPEAFFYSLLANFATRTASYIFFYWHKALRAEKRKLSFLSARRFDQRFASQISK